MKVKTDNLSGAALDWAVAEADGVLIERKQYSQPDDWVWYHKGLTYSPTQYWEQAGPIIEREKIDVMWCGIVWSAYCMTPDGERQLETSGPTPLIAAMRAYVASKMGDEIEVPEGLYESQG